MVRAYFDFDDHDDDDDGDDDDGCKWMLGLEVSW